MTGSVQIALVLRSGGDYDAEDVGRLCSALEASAPGVPRFCLSDVAVPGCNRIRLRSSWPGWWAKMEVFRPDIPGDLLYVDLDTITVGDLSPLLGQCNGHPIMLRDFYHQARVGSGLMYLPEVTRAQVWERWIASPADFIREYSERTVEKWGDQAFLADHMAEVPHRWQDVAPGAVVSYKADVRGRRALPAGARVVCFHGKPRPRDIGWRLPGVPPRPYRRREPERPASSSATVEVAPDFDLWTGSTVFLVGGGPSASEVDFDAIRGRGLVVAINDAAKRLPWADVLFTADMSYVSRRTDFIRSFAGRRVLAAPADYRMPGGLGEIERVTRHDAAAVSEDPGATVHTNSGMSALMLAVARGAARVVLIGFDMNGPGHWFGEYEWCCRLGVENYPDWVAQMEAVADWIAERGCEVVNTNPGSAIRCFRFLTLGEVL